MSEESSQLLQAQAFVERFFPEKVSAFNSYCVKAIGRIHPDDDLFVLLELLGWQALILEETLERMSAIGQNMQQNVDTAEIGRTVATIIEKYITNDFSTRIDRLEAKIETLTNQLGGSGASERARKLEEVALVLKGFAEQQNQMTSEGISNFSAVASRTNELVKNSVGIEQRIAQTVTNRVVWGVVVASGIFAGIHYFLPRWH